MNDLSFAGRRTSTRADRVVTQERHFRAGQAVIGVVGLGYVGLPLTLAAVQAGYRVIGFDVNADRVARLRDGESVLSHVAAGDVAHAVASGAFRPTDDMGELDRPDALIVCVPTPLDGAGQPDLSALRLAAENIARRLRPDQLVSFESTSYPGTMREVVMPLLEAGGLRADRDFFLAYSPEREDPGNRRFPTVSIPKLVAGLDNDARRVALALYGRIVRQTVPVPSIEVAEAAKLTENVFRTVNVALANELKTTFDAMGVDVWEVVRAAGTKPFGYMPFYPGPGVGGHCIPVDPIYLSWRAQSLGVATPLLDTAMAVNASMVRRVRDRLHAALAQRGAEGLFGKRVLVVGIAYKPDIDDVRASPGMRLMTALEDEGAACSYYDPFVPEIPDWHEHSGLAGRRSVAWSTHVLCQFDAAVLATDHGSIRYADLLNAVPLIVDTRNAMGQRGLRGTGVITA
ncbi:nucleotide sugar dehydrogenase [Roseomonas sp. CCTCC AB2023176]|uniref:nucleotide sugar dehydrogenase n=1 Tax=Roseomonas sp. CCTCC AB2023176 TaxID=3342640 RepID=UPI0035E37334